MAKTIIEQLKELAAGDTTTLAKIDAIVAANPQLAVNDRRMGELFGIYLGEEEPKPTPTPTPTPNPTPTHTPALPSAAAAPTPTPTPTPTGDGNAAILASLESLKTSIDDRFKNVVTMDKVKELGDGLLNQAVTSALRSADEISMIRETNRKEFGKELDRAAFEKFVTDNVDPVTKRNKYPTLTAAYDAMVNEDRIAARVAKEVAEQVKQKTSGASVPGQSTTSSLSPAQRVMAEARKNNGGGGSRLQQAIDQLKVLEDSRASAAVN